MNGPEVPVRCVISIGMTRGDIARPRRPVIPAALPAAERSPDANCPDANCVIILERLPCRAFALAALITITRGHPRPAATLAGPRVGIAPLPSGSRSCRLHSSVISRY